MINLKKILFVSVVVLVLVQGGRITKDSGLLRELDVVSWGQCEALSGPVGAEDLSIDFVNKLAYIGADERRTYLIEGDQSGLENGALWLLDLNKPDSQPQKIETDFSGPFHPHGIALRQNEKGAQELYVINHITPTEHEVDVFTIETPLQLKLKRRISFPEMISPNDLTIVGEDQFFMTNDHGNPRHTLMEVLEDYLGLPLSNVVYFDGQHAEVVIEGLRMANGIQISADQEQLFVAETTGRRISRFDKGQNIKDWQFVSSIDVDSGVDNLEWDAQGRLLTGAHPKLFDFMGHMNDLDALSPSEVIRIDVSSPEMSYETIHLDLGAGLSGSSVAAVLGDTLLIGPVFEPHFLRCVK